MSGCPFSNAERSVAIGQIDTLRALWRAHRDGLKLPPPAALGRGNLRFRIGRRALLLLMEPQDVRRMLVGGAPIYQKSAWLRRHFGAVLGDGMLTARTETWRRHRALIAPFFRQDRVQGAQAMVDAKVAAVLDRWAAQREPVAVGEDCRLLSRGVIVDFLFAPDIAAAVCEISDLVDDALAETAKWQHSLTMMLPDGWPRLYSRRLKEAVRKVDAICAEIIARRRAAPPVAEDVVSAMVHNRLADGTALTDREVRDEILNLLMSGYETTARGLNWTALCLAAEPAAVRAIPPAGTGGREAAIERFMCEAMRVFPPVYAIGRDATADNDLSDGPVCAGSIANVSVFHLHHAADVWDDPDRFDPGRFLTQTAARAMAEGRYIPFGLGPRSCIGRQLAEIEMCSFIRQFIDRFEAGVAGPPPHPVGRVALQPSWPVTLALRPKAIAP